MFIYTVSKKHGKSVMVSQKIENLTNEDLDYLEEILKKELRKQQEYQQQFKAKNSYCGDDGSNRINKLRDAFRSQKNLKNMDKW